jgi:hypothetical protein
VLVAYHVVNLCFAGRCKVSSLGTVRTFTPAEPRRPPLLASPHPQRHVSVAVP